jgi:RNA polymerase sigma factor (sigma-70 family)
MEALALGLTAGHAGKAEAARLGELLVHSRQAYKLAVRVLGSATDADDVVQQAYVKVLQHPPAGVPVNELRAWFLRVVANAARDHLRGEARRRKREAMFMPTEEAIAAPIDELVCVLRAAVEGLEEDLRLPVALCCEQGLSRQEAASILDIPDSTLSDRLKAGIEKLREAVRRAGYSAAPAAVLGALAHTGPAVPATLAAAVGRIVSGQTTTVGSGSGAATSAAAKGGIAMKIIVSVVAAGVLAGAAGLSAFGFRLSEPRDTGSGPAAALAVGTNPVAGRQEREEVFEFAQKPAVTKQGDPSTSSTSSGQAGSGQGKWTITFTSKGKCDATVTIVDKDGKAVRRLASGVLGANAPWPFQQNSLSQKLEWDGRDDRGRPAPAGCKVRVGLGLQAAYERQFCFDPYDFPGKRSNAIEGLACDDEGRLYIFGQGLTRVFDQKGGYVRTLAPYPGNLPPGKVASYSFVKTTYGDQVLLTTDRYGPFDTSVSGTVHTAAYSPAARQLLAVRVNDDPRQHTVLIRQSLDGSLTAEDRMSLHKPMAGKKGSVMPSFLGAGGVHLAATADGKTVYVGVDARGSFCHAVYRKSIDELKGPHAPLGEPFLGEKAKPGSDDKHFNGVGGVACDRDGNLYVSDPGNNRIQVFKPDGALVRTLKVDRPGQVYVHPKSGAVYCMTGALNEKQKGHDFKLVKLSPDGGRQAEFPLPDPGSWQNPSVPRFCLDYFSDLPGLWVFGIGSYTMPGKVFRLEDRGGELVKTVDHPATKRDDTPWLKMPRITVDRARELLYVNAPAGVVCFDGKTGEEDKAFFEKVGKSLAGKTESIYAAADGLFYARVGSGMYGPFVVRCTRDGKPVPFDHGVTVPRDLPSIFPKDYKCIWTGELSESNVHQKGFHVAANGDVLARVTGCRTQWYELRKSGAPEPPDAVARFYFNADARNDRMGCHLLRVWDKDGREKIWTAIPGLPYSHGVRMDRQGFVYIGSMFSRPAGQEAPDGLTKHHIPDDTVGSLIRLGDGSGSLPVSTIVSDKEGGGKGPHHLDQGYRWAEKLWVDKFQWAYFGMTGMGTNCSCHHSRFDVDDFSRAFVPAMQLYSVMALDANGNRIARIGRYGNCDSQGPKSLVPDPDIGLAWVRNVQVSDTAIYAMDYGNMRILKAALSYAAEETVPAP